MTVGQEIRRLREEKGWTQAKLGVLSGTGPSGISQIETGRRNPSATTLQHIAEALSVEVADLFPKAQSPLPLEDRQRVPDIEVLGSHFVEPEPGEKPDVVTIKLNFVRLMDENDRLLQRVRELERENAALAEQVAQGKAEAG